MVEPNTLYRVFDLRGACLHEGKTDQEGHAELPLRILNDSSSPLFVSATTILDSKLFLYGHDSTLCPSRATLFSVVLLHAWRHCDCTDHVSLQSRRQADGFIQVWDLQSFLALYGQEFQPEVAEESLQVTNLSSLPNGVVIAPTADVLDYPLGQNRWFYLPDPNSSTAHRIGVVHGGVATVSYVSQFNAYKLEVSSGYENANNYNLSVLMPFMGKWLVGR